MAMVSEMALSPTRGGFMSPKGKPVALSPLLTPASQASTAPNTPMFEALTDPFCSKALSTRFCRALSGSSTGIPEHDGQDFFLGRDDDSPTWSHTMYHAFGSTTDVNQPEIESELGQWAQSMVHAEEAPEARLYPLRSDLGLWAQAFVGTAEWDYEPVRNNSMQDCLAFTMDGKVVNLDGGAAGFPTFRRPALTADGRAIHLEGNAAAFFAHDRSLAEGNLAKAMKKEEVWRSRAMHVAHAACEAEALIEQEKISAIDATGVLHGLLLSTEPGTAIRLKRFHMKKRSRKSSNKADTFVISAGPKGSVCAVLEAGYTPESRHRIQNKRRSFFDRTQLEDESSRLAMVVDIHGIVFL
jgi:hypothetical protein